MVGFPLAAEIQPLVQIFVPSRTEDIVSLFFSLLSDELRFLVCKLNFTLCYLVCLLLKQGAALLNVVQRCVRREWR